MIRVRNPKKYRVIVNNFEYTLSIFIAFPGTLLVVGVMNQLIVYVMEGRLLQWWNPVIHVCFVWVVVMTPIWWITYLMAGEKSNG